MESALNANVSQDPINNERNDSELSMLQEFQEFEDQVYSGRLFDKHKPTAASMDDLDHMKFYPVNCHTNGQSGLISGNSFASNGQATGLSAMSLPRFKGSASRSYYHGLKNAYSVQQLPTIDSESEDVEFVNPHPILVHAQEDPIQTHDQVLARMNSTAGGGTPLPLPVSEQGDRTEAGMGKTSVDLDLRRQLDGQADGRLTDGLAGEVEELSGVAVNGEPSASTRLLLADGKRLPEVELKSRLEQEAAIRRQQQDYIDQLQKCYDSLLAKHALAEVTIDQLRMGGPARQPAVDTDHRDSNLESGDRFYKSSVDISENGVAAGNLSGGGLAQVRRPSEPFCGAQAGLRCAQSTPHLAVPPPPPPPPPGTAGESSDNRRADQITDAVGLRTSATNGGTWSRQIQGRPRSMIVPAAVTASSRQAMETTSVGQGRQPTGEQGQSLSADEDSFEEYPFGREAKGGPLVEGHFNALPSAVEVKRSKNASKRLSQPGGMGGFSALVYGLGPSPSETSLWDTGQQAHHQHQQQHQQQQQQQQQLTPDQVEQALSTLLVDFRRKVDEYRMKSRGRWTGHVGTDLRDLQAFRYMFDRLAKCHEQARHQWQVGEFDPYQGLDEHFCQLNRQLTELSRCFEAVDPPGSAGYQLPRAGECAELVLVTSGDEVEDVEEEQDAEDEDGEDGDVVRSSGGLSPVPGQARSDALPPERIGQLNREYTELMRRFRQTKRQLQLQEQELQQQQHHQRQSGPPHCANSATVSVRRQLLDMTKRLQRLAALADGQSPAIPPPEQLAERFQGHDSGLSIGTLDRTGRQSTRPNQTRNRRLPVKPRANQNSRKTNGFNRLPPLQPAAPRGLTGQSRMGYPPTVSAQAVGTGRGNPRGSGVEGLSSCISNSSSSSSRRSSTCSNTSTGQANQQQHCASPGSLPQGNHLSDSGLADMNSAGAGGWRRKQQQQLQNHRANPSTQAMTFTQALHREIAQLRDSLVTNERSLVDVEGGASQLNDRLNALEASVQFIHAQLREFDYSRSPPGQHHPQQQFFPSAPNEQASPDSSPTPVALSSDTERGRKSRMGCTSRLSTDHLASQQSLVTCRRPPPPPSSTLSSSAAAGTHCRLPRHTEPPRRYSGNSSSFRTIASGGAGGGTASVRSMTGSNDPYLTQVPLEGNGPVVDHPSLMARTLSRIDLSHMDYRVPTVPLAYQSAVAATGSLPGLYPPASAWQATGPPTFVRPALVQGHHRVYTAADDDEQQLSDDTPYQGDLTFQNRFAGYGQGGRFGLARHPPGHLADRRVASSSFSLAAGRPATACDWSTGLREYRDWGGHRYLVQEMQQQQQQQQQPPPPTLPAAPAHCLPDYHLPYHGLPPARTYTQSLADNLHLPHRSDARFIRSRTAWATGQRRPREATADHSVENSADVSEAGSADDSGVKQEEVRELSSLTTMGMGKVAAVASSTPKPSLPLRFANRTVSFVPSEPRPQGCSSFGSSTTSDVLERAVETAASVSRLAHRLRVNLAKARGDVPSSGKPWGVGRRGAT